MTQGATVALEAHMSMVSEVAPRSPSLEQCPLESQLSFFLIFFGVVRFVWLLRSDPVARKFVTHLQKSSFDEKFLKLRFA